MRCCSSGLPRVCCSFLPPDLLARLADEGKEGQRQAAIRTIATSSAIRARRALITNLVRTRGMDLAALGLATKALNRTVYDVERGGWNDLPGRQVRSEGNDPSDDDSVNEAYDGADSTYTFYKEVYERDSVDDAITCARLVFPTPGGPYRMIEDIRSASIARRSSLPGPRMCR